MIIEKRERIYGGEELRKIFDSLPCFVKHDRFEDYQEKLGLLTLFAGARDVYANSTLSWGDETAPKIIRQSAKQHGFFVAVTYPCVTRTIPPQTVKQLGGDPNTPVTFKDQHPDPWSWIVRTRALVYAVNSALDSHQRAALLGYPSCCIQAHEADSRRIEKIFYRLLIEQYHPTTIQELLELQERDVPVENPDLLADGLRRMQETKRKFPFVFHTACSACLVGGFLATADLNNRFKEIAKQVSDTFYHDLCQGPDRTNAFRHKGNG